ncbi:MAG: serine hydrolase [Roseomonas sp.]|nr:serine hydrolase [Roseomonas sp.]
MVDVVDVVIEQSETLDEDCGDWPHWQAAEDVGWSSAGLAALRAEAKKIDTAALMVVVRGRVLHAQGRVGTRFNIHSIRKSLLSALIGIHVAEGHIDLEATLEQLGIDDKLGLTAREKLATVLDLLCARSGVYHPSGYESPWMLSIKPARHSVGPGTTWCYNNWDFNALGTIFRQCSGADIFTDFMSRIGTPCGMQDLDPARDGQYVGLPDSQHPAYPFRMTARDLARFGQMMLEGGQGLVPRDWARLSVLPISEAGHYGAYGYMWWVSRAGVMLPQVIVPEGTYTAAGVRGHYVTVLPALDAVVVHRVDTDRPGTSVSKTQYGRLISLLLAAAPR